MATTKIKHIPTIIVFSLLITGCATTLNDRQRAALTAVAVRVPTAKKDAYHNPDATKSPGMATAIPTATGGGLIPSLIGSAIDAGVKASQQKHFEKSAAKYFDQIKIIAAEAPVAEIQQEVESRLKADDFFSTRLAAQAGNLFFIEINRFGLVRAADAQKEDMKMCYEVVWHVSLKLADGDSVMDAIVVGAAPTGAHIEDFVAKPELIVEQRKAAIEAAGNAFKGILDKKMGRTSR